MATETTKERTRRAPAREAAVIMGCLEERLSLLTGNEDHVARIKELFEELGRRIRNGSSKEVDAP